MYTPSQYQSELLGRNLGEDKVISCDNQTTISNQIINNVLGELHLEHALIAIEVILSWNRIGQIGPAVAMAQADASPCAGVYLLVVEAYGAVGLDGSPVEAAPGQVLVAAPAGAGPCAGTGGGSAVSPGGAPEGGRHPGYGGEHRRDHQPGLLLPGGKGKDRRGGG